jgi:hypothetical protein
MLQQLYITSYNDGYCGCCGGSLRFVPFSKSLCSQNCLSHVGVCLSCLRAVCCVGEGVQSCCLLSNVGTKKVLGWVCKLLHQPKAIVHLCTIRQGPSDLTSLKRLPRHLCKKSSPGRRETVYMHISCDCVLHLLQVSELRKFSQRN